MPAVKYDKAHYQQLKRWGMIDSKLERSSVRRLIDDVWMVNRPARLIYFGKIYQFLDHKQYWTVLGQIWNDSENIHQMMDVWRTYFTKRRPNRDYLMDASERKALMQLAGQLTIYRGFVLPRLKLGMSWTMERDNAVWFANRGSLFAGYKKPPRLAEATCRRRDVLALLNGRNENEIVILPEKLGSVKATRLPLPKDES
jgi:hypothetical protein